LVGVGCRRDGSGAGVVPLGASATVGSGSGVDVTEYEHTPQQGVPGFFGTFLPKTNAQFNRSVGSWLF